MLLHRLRRRFGVAAPRLIVAPHLPWYWRLGLLLLGLVLIACAYYLGLSQQDAGSSGSSATISAPPASSTVQLEALQRQLTMEAVTRQALMRQLEGLQADNARLKETVAFFENMLTNGDRNLELKVYQAVVEPTGVAGEFRYRILLAQGQKEAEPFVGRYEVTVVAQQGSRKLTLTLPGAGASANDFAVQVKVYQRLERSFSLEPEARPRQLIVRVYAAGKQAPKLTQTVAL
jgi:hypothetical protein